MRSAADRPGSALHCYTQIARAGFRRYSTYRQAMVAGLVTNVVFGLLRTGVLLAVFAQRPTVAGYDPAALATFVWLGQGLLAVVQLWGPPEFADRIRRGDVVIDLARPWNLHAALLAEEFGRAGYTVLTRFLPPLLIGALFFPFHAPHEPATYLWFALSMALAVATSFALRFLVNGLTFWLLDVRGVAALYGVSSGTFAGLTVPLSFFPHWAHLLLYATPFPVLMQDPIDVFIEHGSAAGILAQQVLWTLGTLAAGQLMLRRAMHKVVVQGG